MFRPLEVFIGLRYTRAKRRNHFISFISLVSILGIAVGVTALITVISVMNGFDKELKDRILGMVAHATIEGVTCSAGTSAACAAGCAGEFRAGAPPRRCCRPRRRARG